MHRKTVHREIYIRVRMGAEFTLEISYESFHVVRNVYASGAAWSQTAMNEEAATLTDRSVRIRMDRNSMVTPRHTMLMVKARSAERVQLKVF